MCNVTHFLLVIGKDVMGLPSQNDVQCHPLPVGCRKRHDVNTFHKMYNVQVTYMLLVIRKDVMRYATCPNSQVAVGYRKRCDKTAFHKCDVTHLLLVIGKDLMKLPFTKCANVAHNLLVIENNVMRLLFTKCAMSLTACW
jgi:hypothetical protein